MSFAIRSQVRRRFMLGALNAAGVVGVHSVMSSLAFGQARSERVQRTALVMGNADYAFGKLRNPINDARAVSAALQTVGFDVISLKDAGLAHMLEAMKSFAAKSQDSEVRLLFYAGHGVQAKGKNYLVPVDVSMIEEDRLDAQMVSVSELVDKLGALKTGVNIVILDACRTGVSANVARRAGTRSASGGLAQMNAPRGTLIAFSTAPGAVALDGEMEHSAYTKHLVEQMREPGVPVEQVFKRVRIAVAEETRQAQIPWETSSLMGDFCFLSDQAGACAVGATQTRSSK